MSAAEDEVSVSVDGVSVRKMVNDHEFETLAVVLDISSEREGRAMVTVTDVVPEDVDQDDIGFHPEYGGEYWRAEPGEVVFTRTFTQDDAYTTVYGIRGYEGDREVLLEAPAVEVELEDEPDIDDLVSEEDSDAVKGVIAGEADSLAEADEEPSPEAASAGDAEPEPPVGAIAGEAPEEPASAGTEEEPAASPLDDDSTIAEADDPIETGPAAEEPPLEESTGDESPAEEPATEESAVEMAEPTVELEGEDEEVTVPVTGGVARVLAKELRAGNVSTEDRRLLREELLPDDGSTDARIKSLQTTVADLTAYTGALEEFLDEEGGARAVLEEFREDVDALARDLEALEDGLGDVEGEVDELGSAVDASEERLDELDRDVDAVVADVDAAAGRIDDLEADLEAVRDDLAALEELDGRVGRVEDDVVDIREELAELAAFRDRLSSVFGPGGVGGEGIGSAGDVDDEGSADESEE